MTSVVNRVREQNQPVKLVIALVVMNVGIWSPSFIGLYTITTAWRLGAWIHIILIVCLWAHVAWRIRQ